ncbi:hypothetical protein ACWDRB_47760 [Nonomuraea sp. NPDC003707]
MTTAKLSPVWEAFFAGYLRPLSGSFSEENMRQAIQELVSLYDLDQVTFEEIPNDVIRLLAQYCGAPAYDIRPQAFEHYITRDEVFNPGGLTHQQKLLLIRAQVLMVVFIALFGIISAHEDQADKLSLYLGGGALPVAWWCARKVAEQYDKHYGPGQNHD